MHFEFAYFYFFLIHLELSINMFILSVVPSKTIPDSRQNGQSVYPFSDQKGPKTIPFGAADTYMAYIWEYPSPGMSDIISVNRLKPSQRDKITGILS